MRFMDSTHHFVPLTGTCVLPNFDVEYEVDGVTLVRPISAYEVACCFRLESDLTYAIAHTANFCLLDCGVPSLTSGVLLDAILKQLDKICTKNF